jgi:hypothetical protein
MEKTHGWMPPEFVHDLVNKLSVIIGHCDLLRDRLKAGLRCSRRVDVIHTTAQSMANDLNDHQCRVAEAARRARVRKQDVA